MTSSPKRSVSFKEKGLRHNLFIIESLVFVLPICILYYIFYRNNFYLESSQMVIFAFTLALILAGLIILRQIFDRFSTLAISIKLAKDGDTHLIDMQKDTAGLHEITVSFNNLIEKFGDTNRELQHRVFELLAIKELAEIVSKMLHIDDILDTLMEKAMAVSQAQVGSVYMVESEKKRFRVIALKGLNTGLKKNSYININESLAHLVVSDKKPLLVQDIETDSRTKKPNDPQYGPPSFLSMPILVRDDLIAILNLSHKETRQVFDSNDEHILSIMIGEIGFALENAQLHAQVVEQKKDLQERTAELANIKDQFQQEIIERKQAEKALRVSDEKYRAILETIEEGYFEVDLAGNLTFLNDSLCKILGYPRHKLLDMNTQYYTTPETAKKMYHDFNQVYRTGKSARVKDYEIIRKDGMKRVIKLAPSLMRNDQDRPIGFHGIVRDISERLQAEEEKKKLEDQLQQSQKMEAIGTLAGGIAHDFNNILSAIFGYTELAMGNLPEDSRARSNMNKLLKAGERAKDLVKQILTFSRNSKQEQKPILVHPLVKETLKLLRSTLPTTIEIRQNISSANMVLADPTQIHQVIMNLCTNAYHAMDEKGGVLEVSLVDIELDSEFTAKHLNTYPGPYLRLTVSDTGHGIEKKVIDRIFEPYYTTKEKSGGTGMGLAVVHGIVKSHGGIITAYSKPGKGSTFNVFLPRIEHAEAAKETEIRLGKIPTGKERILFIDDEPAIADIAKGMLEHLGYKVEVRTSPIEALAAFKALSDKFDLIISDMTMPKMTGDELAKELMTIRPDIPIILCTGFSEHINEEKAKAIGIQKLVMKPFIMREMAEAIRQVLDS
ncbi:MAG TPA: PAS domain S-box protein [Desulfatiglandales bacterium]|nr:PAS domain S-box protein [Desulfatiglandales bacterium]